MNWINLKEQQPTHNNTIFLCFNKAQYYTGKYNLNEKKLEWYLPSNIYKQYRIEEIKDTVYWCEPIEPK